ncbi:bzip transcription factor [Colletotrichum incanum]|uniref:Bzip transcription factor n=1 Tax=Colletotrichum incanum TaxID=1573173 RepID=A0A161XSB9_COLIC|nr:bzip transcription factor [Colletotrichum incanum]
MATKQPVSAASSKVPDDPKSRRTKKRKLDQRAQRAACDRNKNRIAYLEGTIRSMSELEQSRQISGLMGQLSDMTRQRDNLARTSPSIETTIQGHQEEERVEPSPINQAPQTLSATSQCQCWLRGYEILDSFNLGVEDVAFEISNPGTLAMAWGLPVPDTPGNVIATEMEPPKRVLPDVICECLFLIQDPISLGPHTTSIWRSANEALSGCKMPTKSVLNMEDEMATIFPYESPLTLPPLWKRLRLINTLQFRNCPDTERLPILKFMHLLLRYQAEPTTEQCARLPTWYLSK